MRSPVAGVELVATSVRGCRAVTRGYAHAASGISQVYVRADAEADAPRFLVFQTQISDRGSRVAADLRKPTNESPQHAPKTISAATPELAGQFARDAQF